MSFRFPIRSYDAAALLDPDQLGDALLPAVQEVTQLNEHNWETGCVSSAKRGSATFYDFHYDAASANMDIVAGNNWRPAAGSGVRLQDSGGWQSIISKTYTGSQDRVWALAWAQYGVVDANALSVAENPADKPRVEFALRVNGVVQPGTVTGRDGAPQVNYTGTPRDPNTGTAANDCSTDTRSVQQVSTPGFHVAAVLLQHIQEVPAGTVLVELVARRVAPVTGSETGGSADGVPLYIFSRKILCIQIRDGLDRPSAQTQAAVSFESMYGTVYDATTVAAATGILRTAYNALNVSNILPQGLRWEHVSAATQVQTPLQASQTTGSTTTRTYPGWGSTGSVGVGAWSEVNDGAGTNLRVTGAFDYGANPAFVLLIGNVQLKKADAGATIKAEVYGCFGINQHFSSGTDALLCESQTNNPNVSPGLTTQQDCEVDCPLLAWVDYRTTAPAGPVDYYRIVCTGNGSAAVTTEWTQGSLQYIPFHP